MRAGVVNGIKHATKVEQRNTLPLDFNALGRLVGDFRFFGYFNELPHGNLLRH
jgi:hypothetical protein